MLARVLTILAVSGLSACSGNSGFLGSLNPFGGRDSARTVAASAEIAPGVLVDRLDRAVAEPALRGIILRAAAIAPMQGYHAAQLYPRNEGRPDENGIVRFEFRAMPPSAPRPVGPERTRRLIVATFIHDDDLAGIRGFRIVSATNSVDLAR